MGSPRPVPPPMRRNPGQSADASGRSSTERTRQSVPTPPFRKLRVFAMDPGLTAQFETAVMNQMTLRLPWEDLEPGPIGEYVAVVDVDKDGKQLYDPVDLDHPDLLARDGLTPSDGDPHFH